MQFRSKLSSPELIECEHFEKRNSKIHNVILHLAQAYHILGFENREVLQLISLLPRMEGWMGGWAGGEIENNA